MFIRMCMDLFNIGVEVWVGYWLFDVPEHRRFKRAWVRVLEYIMFLGLIGGLTFVNRILGVRFSNVVNAMQLILYFVLAIIFTKRNILKSLAWSSLYYMSISVLELPGLILSGWITGKPYLKCNNEKIIYDYIYLVIISILLLVFLKISGKVIRTKLNQILVGKLNILWITLAFIEWWIITYFLKIGFQETGSVVFFYNLLFVFCSLLLMIVVLILIVYRQSENEIHLRKLHDAMMDAEYEKIKAEYKRSSKEMHDLKHQINTLDSYLREGRYEAARTFLNEMFGELIDSDKRVHSWSKCPLIDMMLDSKEKKAKERGIIMNIDVSPLENPLSERDMSILLGNILDNAIEAAIKVDRVYRKIDIKIFSKGNIFGISVENSSTMKPVIENGRMLSTKDNKGEHGWGIASIQSIVDKYNGQMETNYTERSFRIDITFFSLDESI